jgi:carboxyl-terminal processing protease
VVVEQEEYGQVVAGLMNEWVIFDWATRYRATNPSIDSLNFELTESDFETFRAFALGENFKYDTETMKIYEQLEETAKEERYFDEASGEFTQLMNRIKPDASRDIAKFKSQIVELLENEIVSRYYYQDGRLRQSIPDDPYLRKSLEVFGSNYSTILAGPASSKK